MQCSAAYRIYQHNMYFILTLTWFAVDGVFMLIVGRGLAGSILLTHLELDCTSVAFYDRFREVDCA